ncbi:MAG: CrcB family protein [Paracoccaceae bacterium]|nr:CrcB family protein [Paracoccaceae bacterium]
MLTTLVYVALGGALGSVLRVLLGMAVTFPFGTLMVNVLGSFLIGLCWASGVDKMAALHPFLMLGVLGGFTTFSTFSLDVLKLVEGGQLGLSAAYVLASVLLSVGACFVGAYLVATS